MNNSDTPIPNEDQWIAYLEGKLSAAEAAAFERENPDAAAERAAKQRKRRKARST